LTPVADAEPSTAFLGNRAELEQMRDAVTSLKAGVRLRPCQAEPHERMITGLCFSHGPDS